MAAFASAVIVNVLSNRDSVCDLRMSEHASNKSTVAHADDLLECCYMCTHLNCTSFVFNDLTCALSTLQ